MKQTHHYLLFLKADVSILHKIYILELLNIFWIKLTYLRREILIQDSIFGVFYYISEAHIMHIWGIGKKKRTKAWKETMHLRSNLKIIKWLKIVLLDENEWLDFLVFNH